MENKQEEKNPFEDRGTHFIAWGKYAYSKCCQVPIVNIDGELRCGKWDCQKPFKKQARPQIQAPKKVQSHGYGRIEELAANGFVNEDNAPEFPVEDVPF